MLGESNASNSGAMLPLGLVDGLLRVHAKLRAT